MPSRLYIWTCVIAVLMTCSMGFSTIVPSSGWTPTLETGQASIDGYSGGSEASAWGDEANLQCGAAGGGYEGASTTVAGWFNWEIYLYTYARAEITLADFEGYPYAGGYSHAESYGYGQGSQTFTSDVDVDYTWYSGNPFIMDSRNDGGSTGSYRGTFSYFAQDQGVSASHEVSAYTLIFSDNTEDRAYGHACAEAWVSMW
jgi:hypothetical protein